MKYQLIKAVSSLKSSKYRYDILKTLSNAILTPSEISVRSQYQQSHVSRFLRELRELRLVTCLNENKKKGRLYQITALGKKTLKVMTQTEGVQNEREC